ncbi:MAG TPA: hypothetical protein K8W15_07210 [Gallibacterium anatis]|uniref:Uncharacterized protein n=1 Tax=Gallibacterium anatis TaxID=750 RepID=A0A921L1J2_9PAST|nr:hypothetical protein [Gallibacterium anatis]
MVFSINNKVYYSPVLSNNSEKFKNINDKSIILQNKR